MKYIANYILLKLVSIFRFNDISSKYVNLRTALNVRKITVKNDTHISKNSQIGKETYIGYRCMITKSVIGNYCSIANNVTIGAGEHDIKRISLSSVFYNNEFEELTKNECKIGDDVWLGNNVTVLRGVNIGRGTVIGANSVVTKDIPSYSIAVGCPARVIRVRFSDELIGKIERSKWWSYEKVEAKKIIECLKNGTN